MKSKVTIKDIAREAGVSVATVSYVLNNRNDQKISDETRDKVLHISNLLNYTPNQVARSLVTQQSNSIVLYYKNSSSLLVRAEQMYTIEVLSSFLHKHDYQLVCLTENTIEKFDWADLILTLDCDKDTFYKIGQLNFKPLIALNSLINDPLFFQITTDYLQLKQKADTFFKGKPYTFISLPINDDNLRHRLLEFFPSTVFLETIDHTLADLTENILIIDDSLDKVFEHHQNKLFLPKLSKEKCAFILRAIEWAKKRQPDKNHDILL
ncbi:LacI family DNA-binding transcriptional regulator [Streptococcus iniae]|uniref:LacI family DNA-binding transcriptional regulator n=1 Tax=Streptococcus iniae TaxID=1346 RepID=UPI002B3104CC|nr:LacI family DNA-binding transcriptional regulator [Streptococcus iniae]WNZ90495.1 LacI family DNA-binding transcriptional regulator [Streptococcus iniae]WNZ92130.1 LacI family DNA-binding transcriptional regulator [Streptococcus iniae]WNZ93530.1 LacI family DNA-binding transcriptional regulator [Streptococcus iniae]WNZ94762.1 LacI family DNA-binding transcriptional regulator [Streptococcus iniae]